MKEKEKEIQDLKEKVSELKNDNQTQESHMKEKEKEIQDLKEKVSELKNDFLEFDCHFSVQKLFP